MIYLLGIPRLVKFIESRRVITQDWGRGRNGELLFNGYGISVWDDEIVLEIDSGDAYITLCMYLMHWIVSLKVVTVENFVLCILYHNKKKIKNLMFIGTLFTIPKWWKQPTCPSTDKWISKLWYIHTMKYYSAIKRYEVLMHAVT